MTEQASIPTLEHHCGSWIIVNRETGNPVIEIFDERAVNLINQNKYEILTALQWLTRLNQKIRNNSPPAAV